MRWMMLAGLAAGLLAAAPGGAEAQKKDRYRISPEEIAERQDFMTAFDAVRQLRSQWLKSARPRGDLGSGAFAINPYRPKPQAPGSAEGQEPEQQASASAAMASRDAAMASAGRKRVDPVVYIDEVKQAELEEALKSVRIGEVSEIRYMNATEASARFGAGHEAGAIMLATRRMPK
jgi:hypothetical protein